MKIGGNRGRYPISKANTNMKSKEKETEIG